MDNMPTWGWLAIAIPPGLIVWSVALTGGNPVEVMVILAILVGLWVMPPIVAHGMMKEKGRSAGAGVALGILLGWLGVLIVACMGTDPALAMSRSKEA